MWKKNEFWLLLTILLIAAIFRLWRIDEYLPFLGDEGRDVRVVARFLTDFDLMFIGPRTSIGDMYLGPAYYYLIAPFLLLFNFSPTGPAVFVALLSVATVYLIWHVAREWFGKVAAYSAALLYAISPTIIGFAQHSWNPNIMPFFALATIYGTWRIWQKRDFVWLVINAVSFAFVLQSHYLGLLLLPLVIVFWLLALKAVRNTAKFRSFLTLSLLGLFVFSILMLPLVLFDVKHDWQNANAMKKFFIERQETVSARPWNALPFLWPLWSDHLVTRVFAAKEALWGLASSTLLLSAFYFWRRYRTMQILFLWLAAGLFGLGLVKQNIYDHYFGFLFAVPFLLFGAVAQSIWDKRLRWLAALLVIVLTWVNLQNNPLKNPSQRQMQRVQEIDRQIIEDSERLPFNFGLIAERNYEEGYLYFFELWKAPVREIDPSNTKETLTEQLYVVCEDTKCEPINHRKAEIANFGWSKIEKQWEAEGHKIFKLVHTQRR